MKKYNIALIGFRATGKSLIGKILARELEWAFLDMDQRLTTFFGQSIDEWVGTHGWESFRDAESNLLRSLTLERRTVVATGGGVVLRAANREILTRHFLVIWLQASPETIYSRLLRDPNTPSQRPALTPLSMEAEIEQLLVQRTPLYENTCDLRLSTDSLRPDELISAGPLADLIRNARSRSAWY